VAASLDFLALAPSDLHFPYLDRMRTSDPTLERAVRSYGLDMRFRDGHPVSATANIVFATEHFVFGELPEGFTLAGPATTWRLSEPEPAATTFPFDRLQKGRPLVYVSSSTVLPFPAADIMGMVKALDGLECQLVLESFHLEPATISSLPPWVIPIGDSARRTLLPDCALVVSHGGGGTVYETVAAGCPQLIVPQGYEQPLQAWLVERAGIGRACDPFDAELFRRAAIALLDPAAPERGRARKMAHELRGRDGCARLAEMLQAAC
jgi:UDP:flavonoid glycosyltransferase YjiC (YdhE family)